MEKGRNEMTERILSFALEIIYLLIGEDCKIVKKTSGENVNLSRYPCVPRGGSKTESPITELPPHSLIHEYNDQKILDLTNKMIELLTGEVPIRCQDVTVHFSVEEWEYVEAHKNLYKEVMMEMHQNPTSLDENSPERSSIASYSEDSPEKNYCVLHDNQVEDLIDIKVEVIEGEEEPYMRDDQPCRKEDLHVNISPVREEHYEFRRHYPFLSRMKCFQALKDKEIESFQLMRTLKL
ncbi:uncharacterized protein [Phyllobates terribilis]|uniref:uncharacterized protein n=1 Tax=Phyllobates terribilis TaxID=111132 RepID=UPI003CCA764B